MGELCGLPAVHTGQTTSARRCDREERSGGSVRPRPSLAAAGAAACSLRGCPPSSAAALELAVHIWRTGGLKSITCPNRQDAGESRGRWRPALSRGWAHVCVCTPRKGLASRAQARLHLPRLHCCSRALLAALPALRRRVRLRRRLLPASGRRRVGAGRRLRVHALLRRRRGVRRVALRKQRGVGGRGSRRVCRCAQQPAAPGWTAGGRDAHRRPRNPGTPRPGPHRRRRAVRRVAAHGLGGGRGVGAHHDTRVAAGEGGRGGGGGGQRGLGWLGRAPAGQPAPPFGAAGPHTPPGQPRPSLTCRARPIEPYAASACTHKH